MAEGQKNEILGRIKGTTRMEELKDVDFVIEAVFEELSLKRV
jgi:3-hydroxybutyryl-CoA dehydrogenase